MEVHLMSQDAIFIAYLLPIVVRLSVLKSNILPEISCFHKCKDTRCYRGNVCPMEECVQATLFDSD